MSAPTVMTHPVAAWFADAAISTAVRHIERSAEELRMCHCVEGQWHGAHDAQEAYEAELHSARELRALLVALRGPSSPPAAAEPDSGDDGRGLLDRAIDVMRQDGEVSASTLQRTLKVDAARAAVLLTQMEHAGLITAANDDGWHKVRTS